MYGLMLNVLRDLVVREYGAHYWKDICCESGLNMEEGALAKKCYEEHVMTQLISTTAAVLGIQMETLLELFGQQFFQNMKDSGHYKVVRCLGHTLEGFLHNLDTLHDHIAIAYPEMRAPSFRTEKTKTGLLLHYYSCRKGLYPMVIGALKAIAEEFYHLVVDMQMVCAEEEEGALKYHYNILIDMVEGKRSERNLGRLRGNSIIPEIVALPSLVLNDSDNSISSISEAAETPDSPNHLPQTHKKEERSHSTGQMIQRERSCPSSSPLPIPDVEALSKICPHISGMTETIDEGEEEDREDDATPVPHRHSPISSTPLSSPRVSPSPPPSPPTHPCRVSFLPGSPTLHRVMHDAHERRHLRNQVSQTSLPGNMPHPLLPSLPSHSQLNTIQDSQAVCFVNFDTSWPITEPLFQICFPFHIIIDVQLTIRYMGASMARLLPNAIACEEKITDHFRLIRPIASFTYYTVRHGIHNPFVLEMKQPEGGGARSSSGKPLQFRGQMVPVINAERCPILFLGSPRIETVEELQVKGLYLTDLPIHDVTRDLILLSQHFRAEVNVALQLERTKLELEQEKKKVQEEKQRANDLLHAMLPPSVARKLTSSDGRSGEQMVIAEELQMVTILFSDIRDFTTICHRCSPMDVVSMLNDLYTKFDSFTDKHEVYKVETIGDAYMVAAGLLDTSPQHAEAVTNMAFDMREAASLVTTPHTSECIQIRIGIHSGMVVAGVVGTKMPRYCLFGDTVNTASRMESHGESGRVHISQMTYKRLRGRPYIFWNRGKIRVKGLPELQQTYFVEPGEGHELDGATRIMIQTESSPDSDSDWDENEIIPFRKSRNPSFVKYKHMNVVMPTPIGTPAQRSYTSVLDGPSRPHRISQSSKTYSMKERLSGTHSVGSYSFSHSLSSFLEQEGTYRELGVDVGVAGSHHHLAAPLRHRKVSSRSSTGMGMVILAEPEGESVTFTREPGPDSLSVGGEEGGEEDEGEGEEEEDMGLQMRERVQSDSAVKSKKHRRKQKLQKNKCKVS